jgi:hypothetical protein
MCAFGWRARDERRSPLAPRSALGIDYPDTDRIRHIARLAHATLFYAFALGGETPGDLDCERVGPDGTRSDFGDPTRRPPSAPRQASSVASAHNDSAPRTPR